MSRAAITNLDARSFSTLFCGLRCKLCKPPLCTLSAVFMACLTAVLSPLTGLAQNRCNNGVQLEGIVTDATGAMIPGAQVLTTDGERAIADGTGHYVLPCISAGHVSVTVRATGFDAKVVGIATHAGQVAHVNVQLAVATVETNVQVSGNSSGIDGDRGTDTIVLGTQDLRQLSGDPDDFLRQLQILAASGGG